MRNRGHGQRWCWRILFVVGMVHCGLGAPALAQAPAPVAAAPAKPAASAAAAPGGLAPPPAQAYEIKLSGMPEAHGGPGWMGSIVIGALLAGVASIITTLMGLEKRAQLETQLQGARHRHEEDSRKAEELHKSELARLEREAKEGLQAEEQRHRKELAQQEHQFQRGSQHSMLSREDKKIQTERERLQLNASTSDIEFELAAIRLVRERELESAKLIHLFFDKLTSADETERELALLAIGDSVDADVRRMLLKRQNPDQAGAPTDPADPAAPGDPDAGAAPHYDYRHLL